jgi:hypothetical protein
VWHCKGACGESGDVILWVMRAEGVSFNHAVEMLKRDYFPSVRCAALQRWQRELSAILGAWAIWQRQCHEFRSLEPAE